MKSCLTFLFSFQGCVGRKTWWIADIVWLLLVIAAVKLDRQPHNGPILTTVLALTFWPMLAIHVKRWHDRGRSGWWCLVTLAPIFGIPLTIVELGIFGSTQDFTSEYYRGPKSYRDRIRQVYQKSRA
jgi:uncharacterized membrane protein YhaH (DUF805 family)